jgi:hypothetical protein
MTFKFGPQSATVYSTFVLVLAFFSRLALGDHTFFQAGTEASIIAMFCFVTYFAGYKLTGWKSDCGLITFSLLSGVVMYCAGLSMRHGVLFDSQFILVMYSLAASLMYAVGYCDRWFEANYREDDDFDWRS